MYKFLVARAKAQEISEQAGSRSFVNVSERRRLFIDLNLDVRNSEGHSSHQFAIADRFLETKALTSLSTPKTPGKYLANAK